MPRKVKVLEDEIIGSGDPGAVAAAAENQGVPVPELTRVRRATGHEVADKLRHERRLKRLEEKGY